MKTSESIAFTWGSTRTERALAFPCDRCLSHVDGAYFRAVDIHAPAHTIFQWLCQLRVAPYSYDWIDNYGRQSPRSLNPALENLEVDQRVMTIFTLVEFEPDRHLTIVLASAQALAHFGEIAVSYVILPQTAQQCRLVVKLVLHSPNSSLWSLTRWWLPWGDLVMMRKQLLTIKHLAESQFHERALHDDSRLGR
jgi:hypothetical protein